MEEEDHIKKYFKEQLSESMHSIIHIILCGKFSCINLKSHHVYFWLDGTNLDSSRISLILKTNLLIGTQ